jgi:hypothetical protein
VFPSIIFRKGEVEKQKSVVQAEMVCFVGLKTSSDNYCIAKNVTEFPFSD